MDLNLAHLHLLLNHFPTIGFGIGIGLFVVALMAKNEDLKRASLGVFFLLALIAIPTYLSGNAAQEAIAETAGVSEAVIQAHEAAALPAFLLMELIGFIAWLGMWQYRRIKRVPNWAMPSIMVLSLLTFALMTNAANIGGEIRHPEILAGADATQGSTLARDIGLFVTNDVWVWPTAEALHFIGLCVLFAVVLLVNLRVLGMAKSISFAAVYQLLPVGMLAFGLNLVTGMLFFLSTPGQYTKNVAFHWKIVCLFLAGINILYFMLFDDAWNVKEGNDAPLRAKIMAGASIFLWLGVLYFGHMLPFIGNSF
jgi:uncharacterized membrane protein